MITGGNVIQTLRKKNHAYFAWPIFHRNIYFQHSYRVMNVVIESIFLMDGVWSLLHLCYFFIYTRRKNLVKGVSIYLFVDYRIAVKHSLLLSTLYMVYNKTR